jgi:hypothetical protein
MRIKQRLDTIVEDFVIIRKDYFDGHGQFLREKRQPVAALSIFSLGKTEA